MVLIKRLYIEGKMNATSVFYSQIYPYLLLGRCLPPVGLRPVSWEHRNWQEEPRP
jgi:hypothetical protein